MGGMEVAAWLGKALSTGAEKVITVSGVAAVSQLIGAAIDIPTAAMESVTQGIRDRADARSTVTKALAEVAAKNAVGDPAIMERALNSMLQRQYRAQENREAVAKVAIESLMLSPPVSDNGGPSAQFMTNFEQYAEGATSEDLRLMFGRLLAGEIRKPGSVSPSTMHFVSMLDTDTANLIQRVLPACSVDAAYLENIEPRLNVPEITYLEQSGFWAAGKTLPLTFNNEGSLMRLLRSGEGCQCIGAPNSTIYLDLAILSRPGRDLVAVTETPFDYPRMADTFFQKGVHHFRAGKFQYSDNLVYLPRADILERTARA